MALLTVNPAQCIYSWDCCQGQELWRIKSNVFIWNLPNWGNRILWGAQSQMGMRQTGFICLHLFFVHQVIVYKDGLEMGAVQEHLQWVLLWSMLVWMVLHEAGMYIAFDQMYEMTALSPPICTLSTCWGFPSAVPWVSRGISRVCILSLPATVIWCSRKNWWMLALHYTPQKLEERWFWWDVSVVIGKVELAESSGARSFWVTEKSEHCLRTKGSWTGEFFQGCLTVFCINLASGPLVCLI